MIILLTQDLNSVPKKHVKNSTRIIEDKDTKIKFLVEEGGFPGCSDLGKQIFIQEYA